MMMLICIKKHLSNIWSSIHQKAKHSWGWLKKSVAFKKTVYFVGTYNEAYLIHFCFVMNLKLFLRDCFVRNLKLFLRESWRISFSRPDFVDSEIVIWGLSSLRGFYKKSSPFFQKNDMCYIIKRKSHLFE